MEGDYFNTSHGQYNFSFSSTPVGQSNSYTVNNIMQTHNNNSFMGMGMGNNNMQGNYESNPFLFTEGTSSFMPPSTDNVYNQWTSTTSSRDRIDLSRNRKTKRKRSEGDLTQTQQQKQEFSIPIPDCMPQDDIICEDGTSSESVLTKRMRLMKPFVSDPIPESLFPWKDDTTATMYNNYIYRYEKGGMIAEQDIVQDEKSEMVNIIIKTLTGRSVSITMDVNKSIRELKRVLEQKEGIPENQQRIILHGKQIADGKTFREYGVKNGMILHLVLALRG